MKRFVAGIAAASLALAGMLAGAGVAAADVIVKPGQFGHVCSGYQYLPSDHSLYWQSCAWADNNEVYFTVHFGNTADYNFVLERVAVNYYKSGVGYLCNSVPNFSVPAHSVKQTASNVCVLHRARAAYQSIGFPVGYTAAVSDTLQVQ
jgi:hypothetical protein